jgi:hypothetical protein
VKSCFLLNGIKVEASVFEVVLCFIKIRLTFPMKVSHDCFGSTLEHGIDNSRIIPVDREEAIARRCSNMRERVIG